MSNVLKKLAPTPRGPAGLACLPSLLPALLAVLITTLLAAPSLAGASAPDVSPDASPDVISDSSLPLVFEPNQGQSGDAVRFLGRSSTGLVFLTDDAVVFSLTDPTATPASTETADAPLGLESRPKPEDAQRHTVRLRPVSARPAVLEGGDVLASRSTYVRLDRGEISHDVAHFGHVAYRDVYPGIDWKIYGDRSTLRYDWIVEPGADPSQIALAVDGATSLRLDETGALLADTPFGPLAQAAPFTYQVVDGERVEIASAFRLGDDGLVRFQVGNYDRDRDLVIDPSVAWKRCLGAWGGLTYAEDVAVTPNGQAYLAGRTEAPAFPTPGGLQQTKGVGYDVFVAKLRLDGTLHRATFLDSGNEFDYAAAVELDDSNNVYVAGRYSTSTTSALFVTKLGPLLDSLFFARSFGGGFMEDLAVDAVGNFVAVGYTNDPDFCTGLLAGTCLFKSTPEATDAFAVKFDRWGNPSWARLLGDGANQAAYAVDLDAAGSVYLGGLDGTPLDYNSFVRKLYSTGTGGFWNYRLIRTNEPSGQGYLWVRDLAVDDLGNTHIAGSVFGAYLPVRNAVQPHFGGAIDAFVGQVNSSGANLVYLTYLGGAQAEQASGIAVGDNRHAYVVGDRFDQDADGDMFVARYSAGGTSRVFYRKIGGQYRDSARGVALDSSRNMYVAGTTESNDFGGACALGALGLPSQAGVVVKYLP